MTTRCRQTFLHEAVRTSIASDDANTAETVKRTFREARTTREYHDLQLEELLETIKYEKDSSGKPKYEVLANLLWTATKRDVIFFTYDLSNVLKAYFANEPHVYVATNRCVMSVATPHLYNLQRSVKIHQDALQREHTSIVNIIRTLVKMGIGKRDFHYACLRAYICGTIANCSTYLFHERETFAKSLEVSSPCVRETNFVYIAMIHVLEDLIDGTQGEGRCDLITGVLFDADDGEAEPYEYLCPGGVDGTTKSANHELNEAAIHYFLAMFHYSVLCRYRHKKLAFDAFDRAVDICEKQALPPYAACEFIASQLESLKMRLSLLSRCPETSQMPLPLFDRLTTSVAVLDKNGHVDNVGSDEECEENESADSEGQLDLFASRPTGMHLSVRDM